MGNETKNQCCKRIANDRWSLHYHPCGRTATVERDGKWYCKIHDPEYIKSKQEVASHKWQARMDLDHVKFIALQQCQSVNKDNPLVVAENIVEMVKILKTLTMGYSNYGEYFSKWPNASGQIKQVFDLLNKISEAK